MDPIQFQRMCADEGLAKGIKRAGADVAEHDPDRTRCQFGYGRIALGRAMGLHRAAGRLCAIIWCCGHQFAVTAYPDQFKQKSGLLQAYC